MDDGQSLPPFYERGAIWCVVRRFNQQTLWRRINCKPHNRALPRFGCVETFPAAGADEMAKQAAIKTKQPMGILPAVQYDNPYLEVAAETGGGFGKILKFVKGEFVIGEDVIPEGTECIAYLDQLARAWIKFENDAVADRKIELVACGKKLPAREELGDNDSSKWQTDDNGNPRDPWVKQWLLPLVKVDDQDCMVFVTSSRGGDTAIGTLCGTYGRSNRKGLLPIIALKVRSYKHQEYGKIKTPDLPIVGWHHAGAPTPETTSLAPSPSNMNDDLNDSIPF